jgi:hypothetical protein
MNKPWLKKKEAGKTVPVMGANIVTKKLSFGESRASIKPAMKYNPITKQQELDQTLAGLLRTVSMIESWDLTDETDKPLPVTIETLDSLDEEFVAELMQKLNSEDENEVTAEEKK